MDISKLTVDLPVDKFYNTYVETIRRLYEENFIVKNNLVPSSQESFNRSMSKKADISIEKRDVKAYTVSDLRAIVEDTNAKYEEYSSDSYSASVKSKGRARYILLSTILKETFLRLGYDDLAKELKYTEKNITAAENLVASTLQEEKKEEDDSMASNVELLKSSLSIAKSTVLSYDDGKLSNKDKEKLKKLSVTLKDVLDKTAGSISGKKGTNDIRDLISQGEQLVARIQDMIAGKVVEDIKEEIGSDVVIPFEDITRTLKVLPGLIMNYQNLISDHDELLNENKLLYNDLQEKTRECIALQNKCEELKNKVANSYNISDNEDELVKLAKEIINKISDRNKLKDIGMVIMMKAL